jgi:thioredoxin 1
MAVESVSDTNFQAEVLGSEVPVLIDFYADWCAPCRQLSPIVEEIASELAGKVKVVKIDVDRSPAVAGSFQVRSIPTLAVIHGRQIVAQQAGVVPKEVILEMLAPVLPADASQLKPEELAAALETRRVLPVDVRDARSHGRARIPGAVHFDPTTLREKAATLKGTDGRLRVLYGRTTEEAKSVADALREQGVEVAFLEGGFLHWEADGHPVEKPD